MEIIGLDNKIIVRLMKNLLFYTFVIGLCFCSCSGNSFYVDIQNQSLVRCNKQGMQTISIYLSEKTDHKSSLYPVGNKDFYLIKHREQRASKDNSIYFMRPNKNYDVFFNDSLVPNGIISLKPKTEYNVVHISDGDATPSSILIKTDKNGVIESVDKTRCE